MLLPLALALQITPPPASRIWHEDERAWLTDLSVVTAVAVTRNVVYAAIPGGLAVYDRAFRTWKQTVGPLDGFPPVQITAMTADPLDDTAWLAGPGEWLSFAPFSQRLDGGALPGAVDAVVLDARDPSRGAYFHTGAGWYLVRRGSLFAEPATDVPPPGSRVGGLSYQQLIARAPALDAIRFRVTRDEHLHDWPLSAAAVEPLSNQIVIGTAGNGAFEVDPLTYDAQPLPKGALGGAIGALAAEGGQLCAASDLRARAARSGITCFDESLRELSYVETAGLARLPGTVARRLLLTREALWVATDQGLLRVDRRAGGVRQIGTREGLPSLDVYALAAAASGVWAGTAQGLALVADTGRAPTIERSMLSGPVLALTEVGDTLWAGTPAGIAILPPLGDALLLLDTPLPARVPIVALAHRGDTIVAATQSRFVLRTPGGWRVMDVPGQSVGRITALAADAAGLWVAGTAGLAFFDPSRPLWSALVAPGDVPQPVRDVALTHDYVFVATEIGVVRFRRDVLVP